MQILFIVDYLPYPPVSGDRIRIYNLLKRIASRHEISLACFLEGPADVEGLSELSRFCSRIEVAALSRHSPLWHLPGVIKLILRGRPPEIKFLQSAELQKKIMRLGLKSEFDVVQVEHPRMAPYLEILPRDKRYKTFLTFHNFAFQQYRLISQIEQRWDRKIRARMNSFAMGRWEPRYAERFDCCFAVSEKDRQLLLDANPRLRVEVIPNGVDTVLYQPLSEPGISYNLLFIGNMSYQPCVDAVLYFCETIFPIIQSEIGEACLWIVGRDPVPEVMRLKGDRIHVTGRVNDVIPYYARSAVCVVPLRAGGGTRLKILEAMALGKPVVSTSIGCEGLDIINGRHLLIVDDPQDFAQQTIRLLRNQTLRRQIALAARELVVSTYDWDGIAKKMEDQYTNVVGESNGTE